MTIPFKLIPFIKSKAAALNNAHVKSQFLFRLSPAFVLKIQCEINYIEWFCAVFRMALFSIFTAFKSANTIHLQLSFRANPNAGTFTKIPNAIIILCTKFSTTLTITLKITLTITLFITVIIIIIIPIPVRISISISNIIPFNIINTITAGVSKVMTVVTPFTIWWAMRLNLVPNHVYQLNRSVDNNYIQLGSVYVDTCCLTLHPHHYLHHDCCFNLESNRNSGYCLVDSTTSSCARSCLSTEPYCQSWIQSPWSHLYRRLHCSFKLRWNSSNSPLLKYIHTLPMRMHI